MLCDYGEVMTRRIAVVVAVILAVSTGASCSGDGDEAVFCHADGLVSETGEAYGRSADHGCRFVDGVGDPLTELDGKPVCYADGVSPALVDCG